MSRFIILLAGLAASAPAAAQLDPVMLGQGHTLNAAIRAQAQQRGGATNRQQQGYSSRAARAAQTCANLPRVRARLGADNPDVQQLAQACRSAGF